MAEAFSDVIRLDMRADLAYDKAAVVAAAPGALLGLATVVGAKAGEAEVPAAHNLGIDFAAGRQRGERAHRLGLS